MKKREEIAQKLPEKDFKKRYGKDWMAVKMATATKMAKNEEVEQVVEADDKSAKEKDLAAKAPPYDEVTKKYAVEWAAGTDSMESYESETFVRAAKFSMKVIKDAMGLNLPQENV